jgi:hypothetical protein
MFSRFFSNEEFCDFNSSQSPFPPKRATILGSLMTMLKSKEATDSVEEQMKIIGGGGNRNCYKYSN